MATGTWPRIKEVLSEAIELPPAERRAFVDAALADAPDLAAQVRELIAAHDAAADFLVPPAASPAPNAGVAIGRSVGRFTILRQIGEGGMGAVFEAVQDNPRRTVALKLISTPLVTPGMVRRFEQEANILAQLQHRGIAQVYDAGSVEIEQPWGKVRQPFFAMELIRGEPITAYAENAELPVRQRLELMIEVCEAVHYAHEHLVVHRDLKPENILVHDDSGRPQPKILDFGVARIIEPSGEHATLDSGGGAIVGTVAYMSPEQLGEETRSADRRADVYSLGVILYQLLGRQLPYDVSGLTIVAAAALIRGMTPIRLGALDRSLRGDVETIVHKAMEKDPARRYRTAAELAADIRRHLQDEPIVARPASRLYQAAKFARRNRAVVLGTVIAFAALLVATVLSIRFGMNEAEQRRIAVEKTREAERNELLARRQAYRANIAGADSALQAHRAIAARQRLEDVPKEFRGSWEWRHLYSRLDTADQLLTAAEPEAGSAHAAVPLPGARVATAWSDGRIRLWDLASQRPIALLGEPGPALQSIAASPAGDLLAAGGAEGVVRLWDLRTGRPRAELRGHAGPILAVSFSPDGQRLISGARDDTAVRIWSVEPAQLITELPLPPMCDQTCAVSFSPDGRTIAAAPHMEVVLWDADTYEPAGVLAGHSLAVTGLSFSADSRFLATVSRDKTGRVWDLSRREPGRPPPYVPLVGHSSAVASVAMSSDGSLIATGSTDQTVRVWNAATGAEIGFHCGHAAPVTGVSFIHAGPAYRIISVGDAGVRTWSRDGSEPAQLLGRHGSYVYGVDAARGPSGTLVASAGWDNTVRLWNLDSGEPLHTLRTDDVAACVALSRDGSRVIAGAFAGRVSVWDTNTGDQIGSWEADPESDALSVDIAPDGRRCAVGLSSNRIRVWIDSEGEPRDLIGHTHAVTGVRFLPDGRRLLSTSLDGTVRLWDLDSGVTNIVLPGAESAPLAAAVSPDGALVAAGLADGTVQVWDAGSGSLLATLRGHTDKVYSLAFSPTCSRLASGSNDNTIRLWDTVTFEECLELRGHGSYVYAVAFDPAGERLISGSGDATVRVWDTKSRRRVRRRPSE